MGVIELRRTIIQNQPHIASQSGNIANFSTDMKSPLNKCIVDFVPVQEGTGDPSPSNVRPITGFSGISVRRNKKNLFNKSSVTYGKWTDANGVIGNNKGGCISSNIPVNPGDSLTVWYNDVQPYSVSIIELDANLNFIQRNHKMWYNASQDQLVPLTVTIGNTTKYVYLQVYAHNAGDTQSSSMLTSEKVQLEIGTTATEYENYSSNSKSIAFPVMGKNLWNGSFTSKSAADMIWTVNSDGTITVSGTPTGYSYIQSDYFELPSGGQYCVSGALSGVTNVVGDNLTLYDSEKTLLVSLDGGWTNYKVFSTEQYPTAKYIRIAFKRSSNNVAASGTIKPMIEKDVSTASAYEPYTKTCYGGSLDVNTGVLTVKWRTLSLGSINYVVTNYNDTYWFYSVNNEITDMKTIVGNHTLSTLMCGSFKTVPAADIYLGTSGDNAIGEVDSTPARIRVRADSYNNDKTSFKSAMSNVYIAYELASPYTVQLTPQQIKTLVGVNNIYSNANNGIAIEYWKH